MTDDEERERIAGVSADLPYEMQSKMFEQLAAAGVAGAGLTITLVGTILQGSFLVWLATAEFTLAGVAALAGQTHLIDALASRKPLWRKSKLVSAISVMLIGMGVGSLAMTVYVEGKRDAKGAIGGRPQGPPQQRSRRQRSEAQAEPSRLILVLGGWLRCATCLFLAPAHVLAQRRGEPFGLFILLGHGLFLDSRKGPWP